MGEEKEWYDDLGDYASMPPVMADFEPDPKKTGLLLVDIQVYGADPDYGVAKKYSVLYPELARYFSQRFNEMALPNCIRLLKFFREHKLRVFHAAFGALMPDGSDALPLRRIRAEELAKKTGINTLPTVDKFDYQIIDVVKPLPGEPEFNKKTRNSFCGTGLDHTMRMMGIEYIVMVGIITNLCLETSAQGASDLGYKVILVNDASATFTQRDQNTTMRTFHLYFGRVKDTDEVIELLSKKI